MPAYNTYPLKPYNLVQPPAAAHAAQEHLRASLNIIYGCAHIIPPPSSTHLLWLVLLQLAIKLLLASCHANASTSKLSEPGPDHPAGPRPTPSYNRHIVQPPAAAYAAQAQLYESLNRLYG
jgi:hypothetical protein